MKDIQLLSDSRIKVCSYCCKSLSISEFTYTPTEQDNKSLFCKQCESDSNHKYGETNNSVLDRIIRTTSLNRCDVSKHKDLIECYKISKLIKREV